MVIPVLLSVYARLAVRENAFCDGPYRRSNDNPLDVSVGV